MQGYKAHGNASVLSRDKSITECISAVQSSEPQTALHALVLHGDKQHCMHWSCMETNSTACIGAAWRQTALHALELHGNTKTAGMHRCCTEQGCKPGRSAWVQLRGGALQQADGQTDRQTQLHPVAVLQPLLLSSCGAAEAVGAKCDQNWGFCPQNGSWAALIWSQPGAGGGGWAAPRCPQTGPGPAALLMRSATSFPAQPSHGSVICQDPSTPTSLFCAPQFCDL